MAESVCPNPGPHRAEIGLVGGLRSLNCCGGKWETPARNMALKPEQQAEIIALREQQHSTRRVTVPALEEILYEAVPVLDHGFVRVVDYMGDDGAVVQAARVSFGRGTKRSRDDAGLIRYLMRQSHTT